MKPNTISLDDCKEYFYVDDGILYWNLNTGKMKKGDVAGTFNFSSNYFQIRLKNKIYSNSRIIYQLYHNITLELEQEVDHKDGNPKNNSFENLRVCTRAQNSRNRKTQKDNKLKHKNISIYLDSKGYKIYRIRIKKDGKIYKKDFSSHKFLLEQVIEHRNKMLKELHGEFARYI